MIVSIKPQIIKPLSQNHEKAQFFWYQYSPRCACIVAEDFDTVYYFAFYKPKEALAFTQAIQNNYCQRAEVRIPKRFKNANNITCEVKVWGMKEAIFIELVKRDLQEEMSQVPSKAVG